METFFQKTTGLHSLMVGAGKPGALRRVTLSRPQWMLDAEEEEVDGEEETMHEQKEESTNNEHGEGHQRTGATQHQRNKRSKGSHPKGYRDVVRKQRMDEVKAIVQSVKTELQGTSTDSKMLTSASAPALGTVLPPPSPAPERKPIRLRTDITPSPQRLHHAPKSSLMTPSRLPTKFKSTEGGQSLLDRIKDKERILMQELESLNEAYQEAKLRSPWLGAEDGGDSGDFEDVASIARGRRDKDIMVSGPATTNLLSPSLFHYSIQDELELRSVKRRAQNVPEHEQQLKGVKGTAKLRRLVGKMNEMSAVGPRLRSLTTVLPVSEKCELALPYVKGHAQLFQREKLQTGRTFVKAMLREQEKHQRAFYKKKARDRKSHR